MSGDFIILSEKFMFTSFEFAPQHVEDTISNLLEASDYLEIPQDDEQGQRNVFTTGLPLIL